MHLCVIYATQNLLYRIFLQKCKTNLNFWEKFVWDTLTINGTGGGERYHFPILAYCHAGFKALLNNARLFSNS